MIKTSICIIQYIIMNKLIIETILYIFLNKVLNKKHNYFRVHLFCPVAGKLIYALLVLALP